jgi:predicted XRE-type DNA-binding protein
MREKIYKPCNRCGGTGKVKIKQEMLETRDVKKMLNIMKRNSFKQLDLAKVLGVSQGTVNGWFHRKTNLQGKIKPLYFELLKSKGIK